MKKEDKKDKKDKTNQSDPVEALEDIGAALARVFKKYSVSSRRKAWKKINSTKGNQAVNKLLRYPGRSLNIFRSLYFKEWLEKDQNSGL